MANENVASTHLNRWWHVVGGVSMNLALGSLYAWSVFVAPLEKEFHWKRADTSNVFIIAVVVFALIGSFILSRTLVPTLANYLLMEHQALDHDTAFEHIGPRSDLYGYPTARPLRKPGDWFSLAPLKRFQRGFEQAAAMHLPEHV